MLRVQKKAFLFQYFISSSIMEPKVFANFSRRHFNQLYQSPNQGGGKDGNTDDFFSACGPGMGAHGTRTVRLWNDKALYGDF